FEEGFNKAGHIKINDVMRIVVAGDMNKDDPVVLVRIRSGIQVVPIKADFPLEMKVGRYSLHHGARQSFCEVESGLVLVGPIEPVKAVLQRDKSPDMSASMQQLIAGTDFRQGMAMVLSLKDLGAQARREAFDFGKGGNAELADTLE